MSTNTYPAAELPARNLEGQALGAKGRTTRRRLLAAIETLLNERPLHDISVAQVAQAAGTSTATFYLYFRDVPHAALIVINSHTQSTPRLLAMIREPWLGDGSAQAQSFVRAYIDNWIRQGAIFRVRNLAAEGGDPDFLAARELAVRPLLDALSGRLQDLRTAGNMSADVPPAAMSGVLIALLERISAVIHLSRYDSAITPDGIAAATAHLLASALASRLGAG